jgi:hypothetical protein
MGRSAGEVEISVVGVQFRGLPAEGNYFVANNKHERTGSDVYNSRNSRKISMLALPKSTTRLWRRRKQS